MFRIIITLLVNVKNLINYQPISISRTEFISIYALPSR